MLWDNHWLAMPGEVTEWWNFQSMMASNTIGYIRYVVKRHVLKHSLFEAYSFRTHTFPHHVSAKVWTWIAKMVVWCSEPKGAQRSACSQHQKQDKNMNFTAGVCCTLCWSTQNRCHICLPSVHDNVTLRTNCKCLTPECIVITPECNEMALYIYIYYEMVCKRDGESSEDPFSTGLFIGWWSTSLPFMTFSRHYLQRCRGSALRMILEGR